MWYGVVEGVGVKVENRGWMIRGCNFVSRYWWVDEVVREEIMIWVEEKWKCDYGNRVVVWVFDYVWFFECMVEGVGLSYVGGMGEIVKVVGEI